MALNEGLVFVGICIAAIPGVLAFIVNRKTAGTADKKVDAEAYSRAQAIYIDALQQVDTQLQRLRKENSELIAANIRLQKQLDNLEILVVKLRRVIDKGNYDDEEAGRSAP